jgi:hypothetical protein
MVGQMQTVANAFQNISMFRLKVEFLQSGPNNQALSGYLCPYERLLDWRVRHFYSPR